QWNSHHFNISNDLTIRLLFYFVDKTIHGAGDLGKVNTKPLPIKCCRHQIIIFRSNIYNTRDKTGIAIITGTVNSRNKFIVKVLYILVILTVLVALVFLVVYKGDNNRVFELNVECISVFVARIATWHQVLPEQGRP